MFACSHNFFAVFVERNYDHAATAPPLEPAGPSTALWTPSLFTASTSAANFKRQHHVHHTITSLHLSSTPSPPPRAFDFLTPRDPKTVDTVTVKEHSLDGKLSDLTCAILRDEQDRTAKIFVDGVLVKDTGCPRGLGFVTFDSEMAVESTLGGLLAILNKPIEVKRAQPRGNMGEEENNNRGFGRGCGSNQQFGPGNGGGGFAPHNPMWNLLFSTSQSKSSVHSPAINCAMAK